MEKMSKKNSKKTPFALVQTKLIRVEYSRDTATYTYRVVYVLGIPIKSEQVYPLR
jgi:hypothetical protein